MPSETAKHVRFRQDLHFALCALKIHFKTKNESRYSLIKCASNKAEQGKPHLHCFAHIRFFYNISIFCLSLI